MRGILFLQMQMQGKKRSKVGHLARLFNAADAFSGAKYTRKSKCQDALRPSEHTNTFQTASALRIIACTENGTAHAHMGGAAGHGDGHIGRHAHRQHIRRHAFYLQLRQQ